MDGGHLQPPDEQNEAARREEEVWHNMMILLLAFDLATYKIDPVSPSRRMQHSICLTRIQELKRFLLSALMVHGSLKQ